MDQYKIMFFLPHSLVVRLPMLRVRKATIGVSEFIDSRRGKERDLFEPG
jgi:hypothetical protein